MLPCLFVPIERSASVNQLQIQSIIWTSTLQIRKHEYSGDFDLIILFVGILRCMLLTWMLWVCSQFYPLRF